MRQKANPYCMKSGDEKDRRRGRQEPQRLTVTMVTSQLNQIAHSERRNHGKEKLKSWEQM